MTKNDSMHWATRASLVKTARAHAFFAANSHRSRTGEPRAVKPRRLHLMLWLGKGDRARDDDNLSAALTAIRDGIVEAGWLVDDSPRWCTGTVSQDRAKDGKRRVGVTLWE